MSTIDLVDSDDRRPWIRPTLRRLSGGSDARSGFYKFTVETVVPIGPYGTFEAAGPFPS